MQSQPTTANSTAADGINPSDREALLLDDLVEEVARLADAIEELNELKRREREGWQ